MEIFEARNICLLCSSNRLASGRQQKQCNCSFEVGKKETYKYNKMIRRRMNKEEK